mgnify:CR=1 FL=1
MLPAGWLRCSAVVVCDEGGSWLMRLLPTHAVGELASCLAVTMRAPLQSVVTVELTFSVVRGLLHRVQLGRATETLPPALQEPLAQTAQLAPPEPAGQRVSVAYMRACTSGPR